MSIEQQLTRSGFAQLYVKAAKIRHADLSDFFKKHQTCPEETEGGELMHGGELEPAIEAASQLLDFLQRAASYLNENDCYRR
jgi:hypothetical protein